MRSNLRQKYFWYLVPNVLKYNIILSIKLNYNLKYQVWTLNTTEISKIKNHVHVFVLQRAGVTTCMHFHRKFISNFYILISNFIRSITSIHINNFSTFFFFFCKIQFLNFNINFIQFSQMMCWLPQTWNSLLLILCNTVIDQMFI